MHRTSDSARGAAVVSALVHNIKGNFDFPVVLQNVFLYFGVLSLLL
jgi:hypothetical protein